MCSLAAALLVLALTGKGVFRSSGDNASLWVMGVNRISAPLSGLP